MNYPVKMSRSFEEWATQRYDPVLTSAGQTPEEAGVRDQKDKRSRRKWANGSKVTWESWV